MPMCIKQLVGCWHRARTPQMKVLSLLLLSLSASGSVCSSVSGIHRWDSKNTPELQAMRRYWVLRVPGPRPRDVFIFQARTCGWHSCPDSKRDDYKLDKAGRNGVASTQMRTEFFAQQLNKQTNTKQQELSPITNKDFSVLRATPGTESRGSNTAVTDISQLL